MHPEKVKRRQRRHAAVSCLCALALALGTAVPYLAWAEGEAVEQPALEASDAPAPGDGALPETGSADGGEAPGGAAAEEEAADAAVEEGAGQGDADSAEDGSEVEGAGIEAGAPEPEGGADTEVSGSVAGDDAGVAVPGEGQSSDELTTDGTGATVEVERESAPEGASDPAAEDPQGEVTVTFYGPSKTEKTFPVGTVLTAADLPSAPATCKFDDVWFEGGYEGTFVGWYKGEIKNGLAYLDTAEGNAVTLHGNADWSLSESHGDLGRCYEAQGTVVKEDASFFPVYHHAEFRYIVFEVALQENETDNTTTSAAPDTFVVPEGYVFTQSDLKYMFEYFTEYAKQFTGDRSFMGIYSMAGFCQGGTVPSGGPLSLNELVGKSPWSFTDTDLADLLVVYGYGDPYEIDEDADEDAPALTVTGGTGIKASGKLSGPNVPEGADIEVGTSKVTSGAAYNDLDAAVPDRIGDIFEVTLLVNGKEIHDGFGEMTISMPVPEAYNGHIIVIYHRHQDGSITTSRAVAKGGYVTFTVTDLSTFALADGGLPADDDGAGGAAAAPDSGDDGEKATSRAPLAQTGDAAPVLALIALASAAAGAAVFAALGVRGRHGRHVRR